MIDIRGKKECQRLKATIDAHEYISFDFFDTLVKRDCHKPTELFTFVEKRIDRTFAVTSHFAVKRVQAESMARKKKSGKEITLAEIYRELVSDDFPFNTEIIMGWEKEYEYNLCQRNPCMWSIYNYCVEQKKHIFILTDMYLPKETIGQILQKLEIRCEALFVSSDIGKMKQDGSLFRHVLEESGIQASQMLHIGDNKRGDYLAPKRLGVHAIHIPKETDLNLYLDKRIKRENSFYADLCAFINNRVTMHHWGTSYQDKAFDFFSETGYEVQGPVLYGYIKWLQEQFKKDGIEKVFFLARDGQLMQKAYRKLSDALPNTYMYASRKALIVPSLWITPNISEIQDAIFWGRSGTIREFLKRIGLNPSDFERIFKENGFSTEVICEYRKLWENPTFLYIFETHLQSQMITQSRAMYDLLLQYLRQIAFCGKVAVVDIGWFGHMQGALERVAKTAKIPVEIHGYYLGVRPGSVSSENIHSKGYLFDQNFRKSYSQKEIMFNSIVEMLFTANHGTVKFYRKEGMVVGPELAEWEYGVGTTAARDYAAICACQEGALTFIDDVLKEKIFFLFDDDPAVTFANWLQLGCYPSNQAAKYFGELHFLDDTVAYLAKPRERWFYFTHPMVFWSEFRCAYWRMGFLTRLFGDKIPYACGYEMLKRFYMICRGKS